MRKWVSHAFCFIVAALVAFAFSPRGASHENQDALNLARLQINDMRRVGDALIAVGERGTILQSRDDARTWQLRHDDGALDITLTAMTVLSPELLLAVGHDGVILRSADAGAHWELVRHADVSGEPLLGVWSADGQRVFAYGSFGKFLISSDAGLTWAAPPLAAVQGEHLNSMDGSGDGVQILVGEMGLALRSVDGGHNWQRLTPFYNGSLFGVARLGGPHWVCYGMRGHVFASHDAGEHWEKVELPHQFPLYGHVLNVEMQGGGQGIVIVGAGGAFVALDGEGVLRETGVFEGVGTLTSVTALQDGTLLVAGQSGLTQGAQALAWAGD